MEKFDKPVIAVDVDDVIAANAAGFVKFSNSRYGTNFTIDDYQEHWAEVWKTDHEEVERRANEYHASGHIAKHEIIEGAFKVLQELKQHFSLVVLTTRRNSINQLTKEWLEKFYPNTFDDVIFSGFFDQPNKESVYLTKGKLAGSIKARYLIDDQLKHVQSAAEIGIKGLLFGEYSWNKTEELPKGVLRVKNWEEVNQYFHNELASKQNNR